MPSVLIGLAGWLVGWLVFSRGGGGQLTGDEEDAKREVKRAMVVLYCFFLVGNT